MPGVAVVFFLQTLCCTQVEGGGDQLSGHEAGPGGGGHVRCPLEHHILQGNYGA